MYDGVAAILHLVITSLELIAAAALIAGFVIATLVWAKEALAQSSPDALKNYRAALARVVLIGLEVLVAATIIKTVTLEPTAKSMGILVAMVAIRTFIGWTSSLEMNGRWPWTRIRRKPN